MRHLKMKLIVIGATALALVSIFISTNYASALNYGNSLNFLNKSTAGTGVQTNTNVSDTIGNIIKIVLSFVGTIFLALTVYAGILWMTAAGKEEQVEKAGKIVKSAIIGLVLAMSAYVVTYFIMSRVGGVNIEGADTNRKRSDIVDVRSCQSNGGECVDIRANGGTPCDPNGTGRADPYTGDILGNCDENNVCCDLKENGTKRCDNMGGTCKNSCASTEVTIGTCDIDGADSQQCCVTN